MAAASTTTRNIRSRPRRCRSELHWFKWEAYFTWISGFSLLVLVYYVGAQSFLIDPGQGAR